MRFLRYRRQNRQGVLVGFILLALIPRLIYLASIPREGILESVDAQGYDLLAQNLVPGTAFHCKIVHHINRTGYVRPSTPFLSLRYTP